MRPFSLQNALQSRRPKLATNFHRNVLVFLKCHTFNLSHGDESCWKCCNSWRRSQWAFLRNILDPILRLHKVLCICRSFPVTGHSCQGPHGRALVITDSYSDLAVAGARGGCKKVSPIVDESGDGASFFIVFPRCAVLCGKPNTML